MLRCVVICEGTEVRDNSGDAPLSMQTAQSNIYPLFGFSEVLSWQHKIPTLDMQVAGLDLDADLRFGQSKSHPS